MVRESLKVRTLIGVERFLFPILLPLFTPRSILTFNSTSVPSHAMTFVRILTVHLPPALITAFSPPLPRTFVPAHAGTFALTPTEPMAGNAHEKPLMPGETPPDGNLVFVFIARNQALPAGTALKRNPEPFFSKPKVLR